MDYGQLWPSKNNPWQVHTMVQFVPMAMPGPVTGSEGVAGSMLSYWRFTPSYAILRRLRSCGTALHSLLRGRSLKKCWSRQGSGTGPVPGWVFCRAGRRARSLQAMPTHYDDWHRSYSGRLGQADLRSSEVNIWYICPKVIKPTTIPYFLPMVGENHPR